jgi:hypothetical protein
VRPLSLTKAEWVEEVVGALASAALTWRVFNALVERDSPMCYAELTDGDAKCLIALGRDRFPTAPSRRAEILRQTSQRPSR